MVRVNDLRGVGKFAGGRHYFDSGSLTPNKHKLLEAEFSTEAHWLVNSIDRRFCSYQ